MPENTSLTPQKLQEAMDALRNSPPTPPCPSLILHPEKARIAREMGYIDANGYLCWDRIAADIGPIEGPDRATIIDIVVDGQRCIYIADADDGV